MPEKQEKLGPLAGAHRLAPGVIRIQLPIRFTGLGHVNMYVLVDDRGAAVIDPGLPGRTTAAAVESGLAEAEISVDRVHTVIATHSHPDHFGGVARLARRSGAAFLTHEEYRVFWSRHGHDWADIDDDTATVEARSRRGVHPWHDPADAVGVGGLARAAHPRRLMYGSVRSPRPDRFVADRDVIGVAGRNWVAVHTPGHTGDHLCLYDREHGILLSGDHVLPTITPHVSALGAGSDPLGTYLGSLTKVAALDVEMVLPAHGLELRDLAGRVKEIHQHHEHRFDDLARVSAEFGRPASTVELSRRIYPERLWGFMAESETFAHLVYLELRGGAVRTDDEGPALFSVLPR